MSPLHGYEIIMSRIVLQTKTNGKQSEFDTLSKNVEFMRHCRARIVSAQQRQIYTGARHHLEMRYYKRVQEKLQVRM